MEGSRPQRKKGYWVYYDIDYDYFGLEYFDNLEAAEDYITETIKSYPRPNSIDNFKLIKGELLPIHAVEVVTKVKSSCRGR
jgi:hypothetical protein